MSGIDFLTPCLIPAIVQTILAGPGLKIKGNIKPKNNKKYWKFIDFIQIIKRPL
ncbi:hypothetical protein [uncultured Gammaproteobacteria bacterium]|nr:hypothetical protein [uncultured Gammaproteobacteria bacterium]